MIATIHKSAAALAVLMVAVFWTSTLVSELFLDVRAVVAVKNAVPYGLILLIPAIAAAGGTGLKLAKGRKAGLLGAKAKRMPFIAANGVLVLIPSAFYLAAKAQAGDFDGGFYAVQGLELLAGAANLALMGLNIRDGRRMTAGRRRKV